MWEKFQICINSVVAHVYCCCCCIWSLSWAIETSANRTETTTHWHLRMKCNTIKLLFDIRRSIVVVAEWQMSLAHSLAFIAALARRKKFESNQVKYPGECEELKRMHAWNFQWLFVDFSSCVSSASSTQISCINQVLLDDISPSQQKQEEENAHLFDHYPFSDL